MGVSEIKRLRKITLDYNVVKSTFLVQFSLVQFQFRIVVSQAQAQQLTQASSPRFQRHHSFEGNGVEQARFYCYCQK